MRGLFERKKNILTRIKLVDQSASILDELQALSLNKLELSNTFVFVSDLWNGIVMTIHENHILFPFIYSLATLSPH